MNNDLISREALRNVILNDRKLDGANANWEVNRILVHIDNAPTVEAYTPEQVKDLVDLNKKLSEERPQGEWVVDMTTREVVCSCCRQSRRDTRTTHIFFCNHCGADMRKGGAE